MRILRNIGLLATCRAGGGQGEIHALPAAAMAWSGGEIAWVGLEADLPEELADAPARDAGGRLVVPGLVDCHTHLAFGGWRAGEFERRIEGATYAEIAEAGGGIASTVRDTRAAPTEELAARARRFLRGMAALGVTTVEAKSGYGLTLEQELRLLRVYRGLSREGERWRRERPGGAGPGSGAGEEAPSRAGEDAGPGAGQGPPSAPLPRIVSTFLGAHVVAPEFGDDRQTYVGLVAGEWIPEVAHRGLARFCDVFLEEGAFTRTEARRVLEAARRHGLRPKLHADQLSDGGGASLAADLEAASADHLEHASPAGLKAMAEAGVVAVTLPLATLYLDQEPPPVWTMLEAGVDVAVATDFNPGSAPSYDLPLALNLACNRQRMTPAQALKGATLYAARAVGEEERIGSLEVGKRADFAVIDAPDPTHWLYHHRPNACLLTVSDGRVLWEAPEAGEGEGGAEDGLPEGRPLSGGPAWELA